MLLKKSDPVVTRRYTKLSRRYSSQLFTTLIVILFNQNPCFQSGLKEFVAVKVVEQARLSDRGKDDIITEIRVMRMLKHEHIVEMKDYIYDVK